MVENQATEREVIAIDLGLGSTWDKLLDSEPADDHADSSIERAPTDTGSSDEKILANFAVDSLSVAATDLLVSLQLHHPAVRTILVSAVGCGGADVFTAALADRAASIANPVVRLHVETTDGHVKITSSLPSLEFEDPTLMMDVALVRRSIQQAAAAGLVVASTSDFLQVHESRVLAATVAGVVLLAQAGVTRERDLREVNRQLVDLGATLLGSVYLERSIG